MLTMVAMGSGLVHGCVSARAPERGDGETVAAQLAGQDVTPVTSQPEPLATLLARPELAELLERAEEMRIQILLGWVETGADGRPRLRQADYRADAEYTYPASTVKLFAAVAALERLHELAAETGHPVDVDTPLVFHPLFTDETREDRDPSNLDGGTITVRHEIRKLFLVSDNEAFNRLYELVGQDRLAASLARAGIPEARLVHRLAEIRNSEENRRSPTIDLVGEGFVLHLDERLAPPLTPHPEVAVEVAEPKGLLIGKAYLRGDERIDEPMDFAGKNRVGLVDLQRGLCKVLLPEVDCGAGTSFDLTDADRALLREAMGQLPRESSNPQYDPAVYPDDWGKMLLPGLLRHLPRERVRIYNKYGQAYGFSTENAWVVDSVSGRSWFLAATIYTNADDVLNDDQYEYATVARPFFAALGEGLAELLTAGP